MIVASVIEVIVKCILAVVVGSAPLVGLFFLIDWLNGDVRDHGGGSWHD
jgi:hypothetical protein